jgi:16S rRNA (adenine1518-N6/adenine1519-N6)-dimethyltransferase
VTSAPLDLTDRATALRAARKAGITLEHRLGQHLLVDRRVLEVIVEALTPGPGDAVLEIGPGIGTLTVELARRAARVVAVELDPACARVARRHTRGAGSVDVVQGDALRIEPASLGLGSRWLAAGNIPYTITGALLTHLLEREDPPQRAVLLVQREVAARLAAGAGDWSLSTLAVRSLATIERITDVPPESFEPRPRVWSSVLRFTPAPAWSAPERAAVLSIARAAFQMRRKTLRHGIARAFGGDADAAGRALDAAGIDPGRRPGELDLEDWHRLANTGAEQPP